MSHQSIRFLFRDATQSLSDNYRFEYGVITEFNQDADRSFTWVWMIPMNANPRYVNNNSEVYQKTWNITFFVLRADLSDSKKDHYNQILDATDLIVDNIINRVNDWYRSSNDIVGALTILNISQIPVIKGHADVFSGWQVSLQVQVSDDFEYCTPDNIALYAGN